MSPRRGALVLAAGRVALGVAVLLAPERVTGRWLGVHSGHPAVRYLARSLGVRDLALGVLVLQTLDDPRLGPSAQAACAVVDSVDALATVAARSDLPVAGAAGTVAVAGGAAAAGFLFAHRLAHP
jgi:hypothetical protein